MFSLLMIHVPLFAALLDSISEKKWTIGLGIGAAVGVLAVGGLLWIAARSNPPVTLNFALVICGSTIGWAMGILVSPNPSESHTFSEYGKGISAFLSGFGLAKVSRILEYALSKSEEGKVAGAVLLTRTLLFVSSFFLFVVFLFVVRSYTP